MSLADVGLRSKDPEFPIQVRVLRRFVEASLGFLQRLVLISLLKQKAGLCVALLQRGPLVVLAAGKAE
jgi:hypothetical protein